MAVANTLTLLLAAASAAVANPTLNAIDTVYAPRDVWRRATDQAPDGYTPTEVDCPDNRPTIRNGSSLSQQEKDWVVTRRNETLTPMRDLLKRLAIPEFDVDSYLADGESDNTAVPNIGLAFSGGGYRAMLCGAGQLAALDSRSAGADAAGNLGGLLQSATYISGLSGGAWMVGSLYTNNFTTVEASLNSGSVWQLDDSILSGPEQYSLLQYYTDVFDSVGGKDDAGFQRSITDYWGRMLSYQLINATDGGPGFTFSSIADDPEFSEGRAPLPFLIAVGRRPDEELTPVNSTVYDFSPWELGTPDNTVRGYMPLRWAGSDFDEGEVTENGRCIEGFDNAGYIMGTSSSLFNSIILYLNDDQSGIVPEGIPDFVVDVVTTVLESIGDDNNDIADWTPNPFKGWNPETNYNVDEDRLTLVDGGSDLQNVPYHPHILKERKVDVVFSFDNSADNNNWPDGASPIATYERSLTNISEGTGFPIIPGKSTFLNLGLNSRPTFFGCDSSNVTDEHPLIVYIPNYPYVFNSSTSTFRTSYNESERDAMIQNGWAIATQLNATRDEEWPVCVGCAMLHRSFERTEADIPAACERCFERYCWNGTIDETEPANYDPDYFGEALNIAESAGAKFVSSTMALAAAGIVAALLI